MWTQSPRMVFSNFLRNACSLSSLPRLVLGPGVGAFECAFAEGASFAGALLTVLTFSEGLFLRFEETVRDGPDVDALSKRNIW